MGSIEDAVHMAYQVNVSSDLDAVRSFVENVDIVCDGLRTAYQVDEFSQHMSVKSTRKLVCAIHTAFHFQRKVVVGVLSQGDILIINPKRFRDKYDQLVSGEWSNVIIPLNIGGIAPFDLNTSPYIREKVQTSLTVMCSGLYEMCKYNSTPDVVSLEFAVQESDIRVVHINADEMVLGRDFFLGWMLDYTCVYHTIPPSSAVDEADRGGSEEEQAQSFSSCVNGSASYPDHCIFFEKLLRVTVTGVCPSNRFDYSDERYGLADLYMVTLKQFTIPLSFLNRDSLLVFKGMVERSVQELRQYHLPNSSVVQELVITYDDILLDSFKLV